MGKTSSAVKDRYNAKTYDEIKVRVSKGHKTEIQAYAESCGQSVNSFVNRAIDSAMAHNGLQKAQEGQSNTSIVSLSPDTISKAFKAAQTVGETTEEFLTRSVEEQASRDSRLLEIGVHPKTGKRLNMMEQDKEGGEHGN